MRRNRPHRHGIEPLEVRRLLAAVTWDGGGDGVNWDSAGNWSNDQVPTSADDVSIDVPGPLTVIARGTQQARSVLNRETLWVQGNGTFGGAFLGITNDLANEGTLRLESIDAAWSCATSVGGTLSNASGATITVGVGTGGPRQLLGSLTNNGAVDAATDVSVGTQPSNVLNQLAGTINQTSGRFTFVNGRFNFVGGALSGNVYLQNGTADIAATAGASTLICEANCTLLRNLSSSATVWVQGNNVAGGSTLTTAVGAENRGILLLRSIDAGWTTQLNADPGGFTNAATGVIRAGLGSGGNRFLSGSFINQGTIDGGDATFNLFGSYDAAGGVTANDVRLRSVNLRNSAATAAPTQLVLSGTTALLTDVQPNMELWVQGNNTEGTATLNINPASAVNRGVIRMESIEAGWNVGVNILNTLNNLTGVFRTAAGTGGSRSLTGNLDNHSTIDLGVSLFWSASGKVFNQNAGTISGARLTLDLGRMNFAGGVLAAAVAVRNGEINIPASAGASTVIAEGETRLINNLSTLASVWVQGNNFVGGSNLQAAAGASNRGLIRLESIDAAWNTTMTAPNGPFVNEATGEIRSVGGTGGVRRLSGEIRNHGLVSAPGYFLDVFGIYEANGGTVEDAVVRLFGVEVRVTASTSAPTTLRLYGDCTLTTGNLANMTLWVYGNNITGGAKLTSAAAFTNAGVIRLESVDSSWLSHLICDFGITNAAGGVIQTNVGTGGSRFIQVGGDLTNNGLVSLDTGSLVCHNFDGAGTLNVSAGADVAARRIRQNVASLLGGASIAANGTPAATSRIASLTLGPGTSFDLANNVLIAENAYSTVQAALATGFNNFVWNGPGIRTSAAGAVAGSTLGYARATDLGIALPGSYAGQPVTAQSTIVAYTLYGDANLSRTVDIDDFGILASNFNLPGPWVRGDFNYSGTNDIDDFGLLASNFNRALPATPPRLSAADRPQRVFASDRLLVDVLE